MVEIPREIKLDRYEEQAEKWECQFRAEGREIVGKHGRYPIVDEYLLVLHFFQNLYYVDLLTGKILDEARQPALLPPMYQMMIYSHLYHLKKNAAASGRTVTYEELKGNHHVSAWAERTTQGFEEWVSLFDTDLDKIRSAVLDLGGISEKNADYSFSFYVFQDVKFTYLYWRGDDEFPSRLRALYEENVLSFMHQESVIIIGGIGMDRIAKFCK